MDSRWYSFLPVKCDPINDYDALQQKVPYVGLHLCLIQTAQHYNPSTIDVMVDSPSKKQKPARYKLPSSGNLFRVMVVIYNKIERICLVIIQIKTKVLNSNRWRTYCRPMNYDPGRIWRRGEHARLKKKVSGGTVHRPVSQNLILIDITKASLNKS